MTKKNLSILFLGISFLLIFQAGKTQSKNGGLELISVQKIWDKAPHNAFTDLIRHNGQFFCVFREGTKHVSPDGALRVITSKDGEIRCDGENKSGLLGISFPPYNNWNWKDLEVRIGGPDMILLPDGRLLAAVRLYGGEGWSPARTSLCWIDTQTGKLTEALALTSGGDTSYAGMVWYDKMLWVSYYSSHEGKTSIYLAKVNVGN